MVNLFINISIFIKTSKIHYQYIKIRTDFKKNWAPKSVPITILTFYIIEILTVYKL